MRILYGAVPSVFNVNTMSIRSDCFAAGLQQNKICAGRVSVGVLVYVDGVATVSLDMGGR